MDLLTTDNAGTVLTHGHGSLAYTPFGHCSAPKARFDGQWPEPGPAFYMLGAGYRALLPSLGRLDRPDRLSPFSQGGLNAYAFCAADPVNRIDSSGQFFSKLLAMLDAPVAQIKALPHTGIQATVDQTIQVARLVSVQVGARVTVQAQAGQYRALIHRLDFHAQSHRSAASAAFVALHPPTGIIATGTAALEGVLSARRTDEAFRNALPLVRLRGQVLGIERSVTVYVDKSAVRNTLLALKRPRLAKP